MDFRWIGWNLDKVAKHNVSADEAEFVVEHAAAPYPAATRDGTFLVRGQTLAGEYVQVVYVIDDDGTVFVIHARPLTDTEKRQLHRRRR